MVRDVTLLELVTLVSRQVPTEAEIVSTVTHLVNSGTVRLCGTFKGCRFEDDSPPAPRRRE